MTRERGLREDGERERKIERERERGGGVREEDDGERGVERG